MKAKSTSAKAPINTYDPYGGDNPYSPGKPAAPSTFGTTVAPSGYGTTGVELKPPAPSTYSAPAPSNFGTPAPSTYSAPAPSTYGAESKPPAPSKFGAYATPNPYAVGLGGVGSKDGSNVIPPLPTLEKGGGIYTDPGDGVPTKPGDGVPTKPINTDPTDPPITDPPIVDPTPPNPTPPNPGTNRPSGSGGLPTPFVPGGPAPGQTTGPGPNTGGMPGGVGAGVGSGVGLGHPFDPGTNDPPPPPPLGQYDFDPSRYNGGRDMNLANHNVSQSAMARAQFDALQNRAPGQAYDWRQVMAMLLRNGDISYDDQPHGGTDGSAPWTTYHWPDGSTRYYPPPPTYTL